MIVEQVDFVAIPTRDLERAVALEEKGVEFVGDTLDTGVCHMAFFADPDGNSLTLHRRYASPAEGHGQV